MVFAHGSCATDAACRSLKGPAVSGLTGAYSRLHRPFNLIDTHYIFRGCFDYVAPWTLGRRILRSERRGMCNVFLAALWHEWIASRHSALLFVSSAPYLIAHEPALWTHNGL